MKQNTFIKHVETIAPLKGACSWDCSGMQVTSTRNDVHTCLVALDCTPDVIAYALSINADIIITHHPLSITTPQLNQEYYYSSTIRMLYQHNIALYSAHTSLDATIHSVAGFLARQLDLTSIEPIETIYSEYIHAFTIYGINSADCLALFASSGIEYIDYIYNGNTCTVYIHECALLHAKELVSRAGFFYTYNATEKIAKNFGIGCIGIREEAISADALLHLLKTHCDITHSALHGELSTSITTIAYCPGAGSSFISRLHTYPNPIDIYITGEIKHHDALYSTIPLLDVGHFALEETMMCVFTEVLQEQCPSVSITMYHSKPPFVHMTL